MLTMSTALNEEERNKLYPQGIIPFYFWFRREKILDPSARNNSKKNNIQPSTPKKTEKIYSTPGLRRLLFLKKDINQTFKRNP